MSEGLFSLRLEPKIWQPPSLFLRSQTAVLQSTFHKIRCLAKTDRYGSLKFCQGGARETCTRVFRARCLGLSTNLAVLHHRGGNIDSSHWCILLSLSRNLRFSLVRPS